MIPETVYCPYLDFDEKSFGESDIETVLSTRVMPAINLIHAALCKAAGAHVPFKCLGILENKTVFLSFHFMCISLRQAWKISVISSLLSAI